MAAATAEEVALAGKSSAPRRNNAARLFGYDVFISFALGAPPRGTHSYASDLARRLRERDITVFFSEDEAAPGEQLDSTLLKALYRSRILVVIANRGTLQEPRWVRQEVEAFRGRHADRPIIPISVAGALQDATLAEQSQQWLKFGDKIWLDETDDAVANGIASKDLVERLALAPAGRNSNTKWRWVVRVIVAVLTVLTIAAIGFGVYAQKQARIALTNAAEARRQQNIAVARQLAAQASLVVRDNPSQIDRGLLLAVESMRRAPSFDGDIALREGIRRFLELSKVQKAGPFHAVAFGPDSRFVVVTSADNTARILDLPDGQERGALPCAGSAVAFAVSRDGRFLAVSCSDGTLRIISVDMQTQVQQLSGNARILALGFSPDGQHLATGGEDKLARVFETRGWRQVLALKHNGSVTSVSYSPDGRYLVTAVADPPPSADRFSSIHTGDWRIFNATTGKDESSRFEADDGPFSAIAAGPEGKYVAIPFMGSNALLFDATSDHERIDLPGQQVRAVAYSPDGSSVAACGGMAGIDKACRLLLPSSSPRQLLELPVQLDVVGAMAFSPDSRYIATTDLGSGGGTVRIFDAKYGTEVGDIPRQGASAAVSFSPDSRYLAVGMGSKDVRIYQLPSDAILRIPNRGKAASVVLSAGGQYLAHGGTVQVFDLARGNELATKSDLGSASGVAISPDGDYLGLTGPNRELTVFKLDTGDQVFQDGEPEDKIRLFNDSVAVSAEGKRVAINPSGGVKVLELPAGTQAFQKPHVGRIHSLAITPDGRYLGAGLESSGAYVYDVQTRSEILHVPQQSVVYSVAFSPDGRYFASGSLDKIVPIYDVVSRKRILEVNHQQHVFAIAFSNDDRYVATGGLDMTARVFDMASGRELMRLNHSDVVRAVTFSPDGKYLTTASAGDHKDVLVSRYLLRAQDLIQEACSRLNRNLTPEEWKQYLGEEEPYRKTCPGIPD